MKNASIKEVIRQQKLSAQQRKEEEIQMKKQLQRNRLINSILEENERRMEIEEQVSRLERQEYELI
jgi:hypothetical protein